MSSFCNKSIRVHYTITVQQHHFGNVSLPTSTSLHLCIPPNHTQHRYDNIYFHSITLTHLYITYLVPKGWVTRMVLTHEEQKTSTQQLLLCVTWWVLKRGIGTKLLLPFPLCHSHSCFIPPWLLWNNITNHKN